MRTSTRYGIGHVGGRSSIAFARLSLAAAIILLLLGAAPLQAQSIVDAQRVEFTPSADNNAFAPDGTAWAAFQCVDEPSCPRERMGVAARLER